jgi:hypothetical protein
MARTAPLDASRLGMLIVVIGVALTTIHVGRADVALSGFVAIWAGLILVMHRSVVTLKYWATLMAAVFAWFFLVSASGSLALWAPAGATGTAAASDTTRGVTSGADLNADVRLTGAQFLVTNNGPSSWRDISLQLTGGSPSDVYATHVDEVAPGRTIALSPARFARADGQTFNAVRTRPRSLSLSARRGDSGRRGTYEVRWQTSASGDPAPARPPA